jgi:hypothetical protein
MVQAIYFRHHYFAIIEIAANNMDSGERDALRQKVNQTYLPFIDRGLGDGRARNLRARVVDQHFRCENPAEQIGM